MDSEIETDKIVAALLTQTLFRSDSSHAADEVMRAYEKMLARVRELEERPVE